MPKQKATFQPTVRPDWAGAMDYMSESEQSKIFQAILMFPSIDLPESAYWNKTIKPDLQNQYETFMNVCEKKAIGIRKRWENAKGIDKYSSVIDMNTTLQDKNSNEQDMLYIVKDKDKNKDKENKGGMGGKREKANETSVFHVDCQNFDEIPADILPVMKKYWTDEKIEKIRQDLAFMPSHDTSVSILFSKYDSDLLKHEEPKPKKKTFVAPTLEEWKAFCQELRLDPKRMESIYYGYSENNWRDSHGNQIKNWKMKIRQVWDKPENKDPDADVPKRPKIADMNNFVRAKRLGEEND